MSAQRNLPAAERFAITEVVSRHGHLVDDGLLEKLGEVFAVDVVYDLTSLGGDVLHGIDTVRDAAKALGDRNPLAHHVTNVLVGAVDDRGVVPVRSKGFALRVDGTVGSVVYEDAVVNTPDGWRIAHRTVSGRRVPLTP